MKKIIVDTNIIFSCLLNSNGKIGDLIFNSENVLTFTAANTCGWKFVSIGTNLKKISKLTDVELETAYDKMLTRLTFINEELIPPDDWQKAETLVMDIDLDDTDFFALSRYFKGSLWTGDKLLHEGLKAKRLRTVYNTQEMYKHRNRMAKL